MAEETCAALLLVGERGLYRVSHVLDGEGLLDDMQDTVLLDKPPCFLLHDAARDDDDRARARAPECVEALEDAGRPSIGSHVHIQDHEGWGEIHIRGDRLVNRAGQANVMPIERTGLLDHVEDRGFVIGDEDARQGST